MAMAMARLCASHGLRRGHGEAFARGRGRRRPQARVGAMWNPRIVASGGLDDPEALAEQFMAEMRKRESKIQAEEDGRKVEVDRTESKKIEDGTEEEKKQVQIVFDTVEKLKEKRDMTFNEVKLTLMIEDPRDAERRKEMGIEVRERCETEERTDSDDACHKKENNRQSTPPTQPMKEQGIEWHGEEWKGTHEADRTERTKTRNNGTGGQWRLPRRHLRGADASQGWIHT